MSDGVTHYEIWRQGWKVALPLSFLVYGASDPIAVWSCSRIGCFSGNIFYSLGTLAGYWFGRYLDPDLDQVGVTSSEGRMINELPILGHVLYGYWSIYGAVFRRHHRSFWTHFPVISTFIRFIYQFWLVYVINYRYLQEFPSLYYAILQILAGIFIGLCYSDFLHWLEDTKTRRKR